ncbi:hypothetical protein [Paenibacillus thermotolerans]|uniref:hypothetical protein n=1 Tax=Paenibacillus thermotolerans TaxID=3027807 RepID=UPI0023685FB2|nr:MULTISPECIES: hypothetical protein [unclassified Paenibacillus]
MHIVATFEYSTELEMCLEKLKSRGIGPENIVAIPIDRRVERSQIFDTIHRSDGKSLVDAACISGVIFMLLGSIYGFVLAWGPIIWGFIGLVFGLLSGFLVDLLLTKNEEKRTKAKYEKSTEVIVTVRCKDGQQGQMVEEIFWSHFALGIGRLINTKHAPSS